MTAIPESIMREARSFAEETSFGSYTYNTLVIARAILAAEERATQRERERCAEIARIDAEWTKRGK